MTKKRKKKISRRTFIGTTGAAASAYLMGCRTAGSSATRLKSDLDGPADQTIVRASIHPGIGVARIGNSKDGFFDGPEVTEPELTKKGGTRDATGAIKRQAARFRIYGYNAAGEVVRELTAKDADITWKVHLANKKAQWYIFLSALDIPEAKNVRCKRRNPSLAGPARKRLVIDPGPRTIRGKNTSGAPYRLDGGKFLDVSVPLGELRTDEQGRLRVLGGLGKSATPTGGIVFDPNDGDTFNNAAGWYDDISDGPVSATVMLNGAEIPVESAWVVVGPPNYAPDVISWRTLYDLLVDTYIEAGMMPAPAKTSFTRDVLPALRRLTNLQWVNAGFAKEYGKGSKLDFDDPALIAKLAAKPELEGVDPNLEVRRNLVRSFRDPELEAIDKKLWPWIYGDAFGSFNGSVRNDLAASPARVAHLRRWAEGDFVSDWDPKAVPPRRIEDVPTAEQPAMLDKAALHFCVADAFHPGCELTWPMRHASMYSAPFRIKQRPEGEAEPDYGPELTFDIARQAGGPLHAQGPGDLTRWMAVPWQGDTIFCRSGYDPDFDPYLPTFWPARVPNHVLAEEDYNLVMNALLPRAQRIAAFKRRKPWVRLVTGDAPQQIHQMVNQFSRMGVVEMRPGVENDPELPSVMLVETLGSAQGLGLAAADSEKSGAPGRIGEAGWESAEQLAQFRKLIGLDR